MSAGEPPVKRQLLDTGQVDRSGASRTDSEVQARLEDYSEGQTKLDLVDCNEAQARLEDCYPVKCLCSVPEQELERHLSRGWTGIKHNH